MAVLVLPVQKGSDIFDARQHQHNSGPDPASDKHVFENLYQYNAKTHDPVMLSDRRGIRRWILLSCEVRAANCERTGCSRLAAQSSQHHSVCYSDACAELNEVRGAWSCCRQGCRL